MIIDSLENSQKYNSLHPLFAPAFEWIKSQDLNNLEDGTYQIQDGLKAIMSSKSGKSTAASLEKFECHQKALDIQLCISGIETIGWKPIAKCHNFNAEYNPEKDVAFYNETPDMYFQLTDNQFGIFYPEDVHAPMIGEGLIKKLVVKVRIS
ncbi:MAG: YhcH/YjgK/YiaL family protein [Pyrinomonadaceae bacterium]|nr:YhcH/YjgK/YiaL family protein [Sphingobacteriaceae bacterium]